MGGTGRHQPRLVARPRLLTVRSRPNVVRFGRFVRILSTDTRGGGLDKGVERGWDFRIEKAGRATFDAPGLDMSSAPCAGGSGDVPAAGPGEPPAAPSALHGMDGR